MERYYYTDPLKAIWMEDKFDMKITCENSPAPLIGVTGFCQLIQFGSGKEKLYIHPDCHKMLEPQVGDLVIQRGNIRLQDKIGTIAPGSKQKDIFFIEADYIDDAKAHEGALIHRVHISKIEILQRNGKAFFMPEIENVNTTNGDV